MEALVVFWVCVVQTCKARISSWWPVVFTVQRCDDHYTCSFTECATEAS